MIKSKEALKSELRANAKLKKAKRILTLFTKKEFCDKRLLSLFILRRIQRSKKILHFIKKIVLSKEDAKIFF